MRNSQKLLKLVTLSMLVATGVIISPILRFEGMCPMAHFINIVCSVMLGPWYSLLCACLIGIIRMILMQIPPLALTGAVFGAFLSGVMFRATKGNLLSAVLGEVIGTGFIGSIVSYPVMTFLWGEKGLTLLFYVPSFVAGTLIGGSIAFIFLRKFALCGVLESFWKKTGSFLYENKSSDAGDAFAVAAFGAVLFSVIKILTGIFGMKGALWSYLAFVCLGAFLVLSLIVYLKKKVKFK